MTGFGEKTFRTRDGLSLYYRDYNGPVGKTPILCLSGTGGNSKVYDDLAPHIAQTRRVLTMDWRGHGRSDRDPDWQHYHYNVDRDDVIEFLAFLGVSKIVTVGTSLGGIVTMHIAGYKPDLLAGSVMNDVGPVIGEAGRLRLHDNMGKPMVFDSFEDAAQAQKERAEVGFAFTDAEWLLRVHRIYAQDPDGKVKANMDPMYGRVFRERKRLPDYWHFFENMKAIPVLAIRGAVSDILDQATLDEMKRRKPDLKTTIVPGRGHCPMLTEPQALAAIDSFLAAIA
ncbi:MAG: alpha/beta hydrolase [Proteobacteria bacterium]|nr:alpha/beta hydrolase [Pseudomonadota bacterium]MDA1059696.1 alpha/beta hydrolase [Pseudomonadota bacterium]